MILIEATINSTVYRCSLEGNDPDDALEWTYNWKPYVVSFTAPQYRMAKAYGGFCKMSFGSIELSPDLFADEWYPPINFPITAKYTATDDSTTETLFTGTAHRSEVTKETIIYDLYGIEYDVDLLAEAEDYNGNIVALPMAIGLVSYEQPVRLPDAGGYPTYHKGSITGTLAKNITVIADNGSGKCRFTTGAAHGFSNADVVTTEDAARNAWDTSAITLINTTTFDKASLAFVANSTGHAYKTGYWGVYDDGVPISGNVTDNGNGTFSLSAVPTGEVSISGTGQDTTLAELIDWACGASYLDLTSDTALWTATIPNISHWAASQKKLVDFLSDICAFFGHLFFISGSTLYLVGMGEDNGTDTITEFEYFDGPYHDRPPVSIFRSKWITRESVSETIGQYVKDIGNDTYQESAYPYGKDESIDPYTGTMADIDTQLEAISTIYHMPYCYLKMPLIGSLPMPGKKISWLDESMGQKTSAYIRARSIRYDFDNEEITIEGEGAMVTAVDELLGAGLGILDLFGGAGLDVS